MASSVRPSNHQLQFAALDGYPEMNPSNQFIFAQASPERRQ
jgi:hypothetical protein